MEIASKEFGVTPEELTEKFKVRTGTTRKYMKGLADPTTRQLRNEILEYLADRL